MAFSLTEPADLSDVRISNIVVNKESLISVDLYVDGVKNDIQWIPDAKAMRVAFPSLLHLSVSQTLKLRVNCRGFYNRSKDIIISAQELSGHQEWNRSYGDVQVAITQSASDNLPSTTDEILQICPRFRVLVVGRAVIQTGAGKSSLINITFGVTEANVSDGLAGESDINTEIICEANQQFVMHDSKGFEAGEEENLRIVQDFLRSRDATVDIKNQVHAVWLCLPIPIAGGRILETGIEDILKLKMSGKLGKLPVIAIFTKFDDLVARVRQRMGPSARANLSPDQIKERVRSNADASLQQYILPFLEYTENKIPHIAVSTKKGYETSLKDLVKLTTDSVREHVAEEPSIVLAIAQRVDPGLKIEACIAIGKRKYWRKITRSVPFFGKTLDACLKVIHRDIMVVWGIPDRGNLLASAEFQALVLGLVGKSAEQNVPERPTSPFAKTLNQLSNVIGAADDSLSSLVQRSAKWVDGRYEQTLGVKISLIAYTIDLTLLMQLLFSVASSKHPISRLLIKRIVNTYKDSGAKAQIHLNVIQYVQGTSKSDETGRDSALDIVENLIKQYSKQSDMFELMRPILLSYRYPVIDDQWDV